LRILFLSIEYPPETGWGGIGSYVKCVAPALAARGHEVHVLSCVHGQVKSDCLDGSVFVHRRGQIRLRGLGHMLLAPGAATRINGAVSCWLAYRSLGVNFDAIEYPDWMGEGWLFALRHSKPLVAHLHTPLYLIKKYNRERLGWSDFLTNLIERRAVRGAHVVTSPSDLLASDLRRDGWLRDHVRIVRYPVDYGTWSTIPLPTSTEPVVLFVGRLETRKAPELLLEAAGLLKSAVPNLRVDFVGRGPDAVLEKLKARATYLGINCRFPGHVDRESLLSWYASARVMAVPSEYENFSMAALEGMASGRPLVTTTESGVAEIFGKSSAGKVVPTGDVGALADALTPYLVDPLAASRAGEAARAMIRMYCAPERIAEEREACYQEAIARWRRSRVSQAGGMPHAAIEAGRLAPRWRDWAVEEAAVAPWKHFYLRTGEHLLRLLQAHPRFAGRKEFRGMRVLDLASTPAVSALLSCMGAKVVPLDLAASEMDKVKNIGTSLDSRSNFLGLRADAFRVPLRPASFDLVLSSGFIEHFDDPMPLVRTMVSLVRPGGAICLLVPSRWTPHTLLLRGIHRRRRGGYYWDRIGRERSYSRRQLTSVLERAGVEVLRASTYNLRRSLADDWLILPRMDRGGLRRSLYMLMNGLDWLEENVPPLRKFGFMVGAVGEVRQ
jgi:glycogen(starch) synthase